MTMSPISELFACLSVKKSVLLYVVSKRLSRYLGYLCAYIRRLNEHLYYLPGTEDRLMIFWVSRCQDCRSDHLHRKSKNIHSFWFS